MQGQTDISDPQEAPERPGLATIETHFLVSVCEFLDHETLIKLACTSQKLRKLIKDRQLEDKVADLELRQAEWNALQRNLGNAGYRDGLDQGHEAALQPGFDQGYQQGTVECFREACARGAAAALLLFHDAHPDICKSLSQKEIGNLTHFVGDSGPVIFGNTRKAGEAGVRIHGRALVSSQTEGAHSQGCCGGKESKGTSGCCKGGGDDGKKGKDCCKGRGDKTCGNVDRHGFQLLESSLKLISVEKKHMDSIYVDVEKTLEKAQAVIIDTSAPVPHRKAAKTSKVAAPSVSSSDAPADPDDDVDFM
uniref:F-box domain-containing protein n=1 Tax=Lotharella oceanica TaxID=641309 RepID=A0A7S2TSU4_9EUKA|mmetsp:Transcript_28424/g.53247  ORF Transcript_28424/g.53247 Transcript_28424/m.53247 type:complete len:307 (+) Transcript_28424:27-947(+)